MGKVIELVTSCMQESSRTWLKYIYPFQKTVAFICDILNIEKVWGLSYTRESKNDYVWVSTSNKWQL